ncbi:MAG: amidohydrolase family protein [Verrucomicrobia bacterium]|nr:amidohydrolase family protein [Verrucomicrobiota bacterium]
MILDTHQHFWKADRGDYHWMTPEVPILARDYLPDDLRGQLRKTGVTQTILVQAAQTMDETDFLLGLAEEADFVMGVIGWFDLEDENFPEVYERKRKDHANLLGVRPMLQDLSDDRWILREKVIKNLSYLADRQIVFEFLTYTRHLPFVLQALEKVTRLHAVIDHISKPEIKAGKLQPWSDLISRVARHENLFCKLSGMVTEADHASWAPEHLRPYIEHVLNCFGEDRVMFGSDWPVCLRAASYGEVINALRTVVANQLSPGGLTKLFSQNGRQFYGIR